jgi:FAD/FMN-containing dehydrogenase
MRLRQLTEAECYARCYRGGNATDHVTVVRLAVPDGGRLTPGETLRKRFEVLLDERGPEAEAA